MASEGVSFKKFVSATELEEKRKERQEEWDKVRTADQPLECPEEEIDPRSLYEKLSSQKEQKQADFEEQFKFKNMVRGIDEDESKFLDEVADRRTEIETRRWKEEKEMLQEMKQYTERVIPVDDTKTKSAHKPQPTEKVGTARIGPSSSGKRTQASLLAGVVKRKRSNSEDRNGEKKMKATSPSSSSSSSEPPAVSPNPDTVSCLRSLPNPAVGDETIDRPAVNANDKARVVSILPGLGFYANSSDSETSSSDSEVDLLNSTIHRAAKKKGGHT